MPEWIRQLDTDIFLMLNLSLQNALFDAIMPFITRKWYLIALPFVIFFLLKGKKERNTSDALAVFAIGIFSILFADGLANVLKHIIGRERPCNTFENVHLLVGCTKSFSMPSNHSANTFAFATAFLIMTKGRLKYFFLFIALLVGLSRVYVGVHYPLDVMGGMAVGAVSSMSIIYLYRWAKRRFADKPYTTAMSVFLLAFSLFRMYYILHGPLDLSPDEAHYWEWSRRLDLSYYSKGPMIAYLIAIGTSVFGDNIFGVRVPAVVFSVLSSIFLYRLGKEMYDEKVGAFSAMLFQVIPIYSIFGIIFTIDSPYIFFWILSLYLFWKAVNPPIPPLTKGGEGGFERGVYEGITNSELQTPNSELKYWLLLGVSIGLGLLTKYSMAFLYICAILYLGFRPAGHKGNGRTSALLHFCTSALISLLVFSPVIIWNARHDWVTFRHTAGQAHIAEGLRISAESFLEFIVSQIGVLTPVLFALMMVALWKIRRHNNGRFLFWLSVPVVVFFIIKSIQGKAQANWAIAGYITGLVAFSEVFMSKWKQHRSRMKTLIIAGICLSVLMTAIAYYPSEFNIPLKFDPLSRRRGWNELGREVGAVYSDMQKQGNVFIFSEKYQVSSELAFYVKGHPVTYCANIGGRRMNQYDLWPGFNNLIHYNAIFVTIGDVELPTEIEDAFDRYERRLLRVYDKGRLLREYAIFLCHDFKGMKEERITSY